jgi:drug/metabolite transporter (DMT)-like permease
MFSWIPLSFLSALSDSFHIFYVKKRTKILEPVFISWFISLFLTIFIFPLALWKGAHPTELFWLVLLARTILDTVATILYVTAIQRSDISLSVPLVAFTPLLIVLFEFLFTGIVPSIFGILGIVFVVGGVYLLYSDGSYKNILAPFKAMNKNQGSKFMLFVAVIWSITSTLHKVAIHETNALFYAGVGSVFLFLSLSATILVLRGRNAFSFVSIDSIRQVIPLGVFGVITLLSQMFAQGMAPASYVISVKRTSILFSAILGALLLNESIRKRIIPILFILIGVIAISFSAV